MASEREYLEKMSTMQLDALLFQELFGREQMRLASILITCEILARREPYRGSAKYIFLEFASRYADKRGASRNETGNPQVTTVIARPERPWQSPAPLIDQGPAN